jgi:cation diffusion facilitator CzcD-associated flavoprotein CzcO
VASAEALVTETRKVRMSNTATTEAARPAALADRWIASLSAALESGRADLVAGLFVEGGWWRDIVALGWDIRTVQGRSAIEAYVREAGLDGVRVAELDELPAPEMVEGGTSPWVQAFFTFRTAAGWGTAVVRLVEDESGQWLAWTLMTALQELNGRELAINGRREHRPAGPEPYTRQRAIDASFRESDPAVLIVGAGQGGLTLAAHLRLMGVPTLIIEKNAQVGDNWRSRYEALVLHDPVWVDALPFMPYPASWPIYAPKDKLADWLESYAAAMDLNVWTGVQLLGNAYSDDDGTWTVQVRDAEGTERTLRPQHLVMATGTLTEPNIPVLPSQDTFAGTILHSSQFDASTEWAGKRAAVIGVCNSGQDIARDLFEHGAEVTLIQRSPVYVYSQDRGVPILLGDLYGETGPPTEIADLINVSLPQPVLLEFGSELAKVMGEADRDLLDGLRARGFLVDDGVEAGGLFGFALRRGGGFVLDVGSSKWIIDGSVSVATGSIAQITPKSVVLESGQEIDADLIVLATGYKNMRESARRIFGDAVADRCSDVWGLDAEGELRSIWRPSGHPGFWFMGGSLSYARIFSRYLALQIAAAVDRRA